MKFLFNKKNSKRKQSYITAQETETEQTPVKTLLMTRGEQMIDSNAVLITPVKIEFLLKDNKKLNLRSEFIKLFQCMKKVDSTLAVVTDESVWYNSSDFPVDDQFMMTFQVTQKNPRRSSQAAQMFVTLSSKSTINLIKYNPKVWNYINTSHIFLQPDHFERQDTACPGYLINIHPNLVWKETLIKEITNMIIFRGEWVLCPFYV